MGIKDMERVNGPDQALDPEGHDEVFFIACHASMAVRDLDWLSAFGPEEPTTMSW